MEIDGDAYYAKPMNCPFHVMIYKSRRRSYRELPLRMGELGTVYRYERSGVLHGLLRARGFTQDDSHIFCSAEQVESEVIQVIAFARSLLQSLGFAHFQAFVATRPAKAVGSDEMWQKATAALEEACRAARLDYAIRRRRRGFLWSQGRHQGHRRARTRMAMLDRSIRFHAAREVRRFVCRTGQPIVSSVHGSPRPFRLPGAVLRRSGGASRRRVPAVARAGAGSGRSGERACSRIRFRRHLGAP